LVAKVLPPAYQNKNWDDVPKSLVVVENVLRTIVFVSSGLLQLEIKQRIQSVGLIIYVCGLVVYFASWILQIRFKQVKWAQSGIVFTAPAYTPVIWLCGIGLIGQRLLFNVWYTYWIYILLSLAFVAVHTRHSLVALRNWNRVNATSFGK
jgi:hypothetical protein